jgi:hypothetical protein
VYSGEGTKVSKFVAVQRLRDEARKKNGGHGPSDDEVEAKLFAGFKIRIGGVNNQCDRCFQLMSKNGKCGCPE